MKTQYTPRSWNDYNKSLIERGNLAIWLTSDTIKGWLSSRKPARQGGRQEIFSDAAILALMFLKALYRMPYRMVQGFAKSLLTLMLIELPIPHFTRICKRSKKLELPKLPGGKRITDIVFDGSGIKIYGEGEWKVEQHGREKKKKWKKIQIGIDPKTQEIILTDVTKKDKNDSTMLPGFLKQIRGKIRRVFGDGIYDTKSCYKALVERGAEPLIPPRKTARLWKGTEAYVQWRNRAVLERRGLGLDPEGLSLWKKLRGYGIIRFLIKKFIGN